MPFGGAIDFAKRDSSIRFLEPRYLAGQWQFHGAQIAFAYALRHFAFGDLLGQLPAEIQFSLFTRSGEERKAQRALDMSRECGGNDED